MPEENHRTATVRERIPVPCHITFPCYGTHLPGEEGGMVDRYHNVPGGRYVPSDPRRLEAVKGQMDQPPYQLDATRREVVLKAIQGVCAHRGWMLLAAHVRMTHVHVVVEAATPPEKVMNDFKSYASRALNEAGLDGPDRKRWARHGSTRYLRNAEEIRAAVQYVVSEQGERMAVFSGDPLPDGRGSVLAQGT